MNEAKSGHAWQFFRIGGLDQVVIRNAEDLLALDQLDQKLWVALSCPVQGLELDERTLRFVDLDKDNRIRVPDILGTIRWAAGYLKDAGELLKETDRLPLSGLTDDTPEGQAMISAGRIMLEGRQAAETESVTLADVQGATALFSSRPFNNDGVITAAATDETAIKQAIEQIIGSVGGVADRSGQPGVDRAKIEEFYTALQNYIQWVERGRNPEVHAFGAGTAATAAAVAAVRSKVDDYFTRTRLAAFDSRAGAALNPPTEEFAALANGELIPIAPAIAAFPLAEVQADRALPLFGSVNPAWAAALAQLHAAAVTPLFGEAQRELTASQWIELKRRLAAFDTWQAERAAVSSVEGLGVERAQQLLAGSERATLLELIDRDLATAPEFGAIENLERLVRLRRDFATLLRNFVNFTDFYSPEKLATFQAGTLYLDSRSTELCVEVADPAAHSKLASLSQTYLAYCDLKRADLPPRKIAASFTQGDGDYLRVGRNGVFYDRKGRDWDATITLIIENPISIRQAFWSPYKKVARFVEEQITKFAAAKEKAADENLARGVVSATAAPAPGAPAAPGAAPARPAFDIAKFAGIFAAIGLAFGAIAGAVTSVATGFLGLSWWQMPLAILGALLIISGPSMLLAALKLRQRTLGPILDANGWAINGRVHISIPFGTRLTERAVLPPGSSRNLNDPYADRGAQTRRRLLIALVILLLAAVVTAWTLKTWPFAREPESVPAPETPAAEAPAASST